MNGPDSPQSSENYHSLPKISDQSAYYYESRQRQRRLQLQQRLRPKRPKRICLLWILALLLSILGTSFLLYNEKLSIKKNERSNGNSLDNNNSEMTLTLSGTIKEDPCASFTLHLELDQFGNETFWEILQLGRQDIVHLDTSNAKVNPEKEEDEEDIANHIEVASNADNNLNAHVSGSNRRYMKNKHRSNNDDEGNDDYNRSNNYYHIGSNGKRNNHQPSTNNKHSKGRNPPLSRFLRRMPSKRSLSTISNTADTASSLLHGHSSSNNGIVVLSGGPYAYSHQSSSSDNNDKGSTTTTTNDINGSEKAIVTGICLSPGQYQFILHDSGNNGICCQFGRGKYGLDFTNGRVIRPLSKGEFVGELEITEFEVTLDDVGVTVSGGIDSAGGVGATSSESEDGLDTLNQSTTTQAKNNDDTTSDTKQTMTTVNNGKPQSPSTKNPLDDATSEQQTSQSSLIPQSSDSDSAISSFATASTQDLPNLNINKAYGILFDVEPQSNTNNNDNNQNSHNNNPKQLAITGMDIYLDRATTTHYEVWAKSGSWQDGENASKGFRKISHGQIVGRGLCRKESGSGRSKGCDFSSIPMKDFQEVVLGGGGGDGEGEGGGNRNSSGRICLWVTLTTDSLVIQNHDDDDDNGVDHHDIAVASNDVVQSSNDDLKVYYGASVLTYPLQLADPETDFHGNKGFLGRLWYRNVSNE